MTPHAKRQARSSKGSFNPSIFFRLFQLFQQATRLTQRDLDLLAGREGFSPAVTIGVARRCRFSMPQVLLCAPMRRSAPFPTTFWLVCPHLDKRIGAIESQNGVDGMEAALAADPDGRAKWADWIAYHEAHARLRLALLSEGRKRYLRRFRPSLFKALRRGGVGGIAYQAHQAYHRGAFYVKCIHLQAASYLALGRHPAGRWLDDSIGEWECERLLCGVNRNKIEEEGSK